MAFEKTYPNRKDWRHNDPWQRRHCRPLTSCTWCLWGKRHRLLKQLLRTWDDEHQDGRQVPPRRKVR